MANDNAAQTFNDNLKGAVEIGGPKQIDALNKELNSMSYPEMAGLNNAIFSFNQKEHQADPNLPTVELIMRHTMEPTSSSTSFDLELVNKDGSQKPLYNRDFIDQHPALAEPMTSGGTVGVIEGLNWNPDPGSSVKQL